MRPAAARPAPGQRAVAIDGIAPLLDLYDCFVLDMWGVLHDGVRPFPGVIDALERLKAAGKRTIVLSNAPRRYTAAIARAAQVGLPALWDGILTSGEQAWQWLAAIDQPRAAANRPWGRPDWLDGLGRSAWYMGAEWNRGADRVPGMLDGLAITAARSIAEASFVLNIGPQPIVQGLADYEADLAAGAARGLPMLCCNPDRVVMVGDRMAVCAGTLAERYLALGGTVHWVGKPDPQIYATVLAMLGDPDPARVICVGDGLHTDIAGAHAAGLDAALVPGSVHGQALGIGPGELPDPQRLAALCAAESQWPRWVLPGLRY